MGKKFARRTEDFVCAHCGQHVKGSGYTNHCPHCLWSKHVDVNPGDRANTCRGLMIPVRIEQKRGNRIIVHRCELCGTEKRNVVAKTDAFEAILSVAERQAKENSQ